jgi:hypothetical protein
MHIEITSEVLLSQLGYSKNEHIQKQIEDIINNTNEFDKFSKHIISLNDKLKHINGYVAVSNSNNYLKIKCDEVKSEQIISEFNEEVNNWATKYNVQLEKLDNKNVYYIIGKK